MEDGLLQRLAGDGVDMPVQDIVVAEQGISRPRRVILGPDAERQRKEGNHQDSEVDREDPENPAHQILRIGLWLPGHEAGDDEA